MDLEKLVKTSLENFEPEVDPAVWQRVEQGLKNAPLSNNPNCTSAASSAGKTALKSVLSHINPWILGAGIITTAVVVTVLLSPSEEKNNSAPKTPSATSSIVIPSAKPLIENTEQAKVDGGNYIPSGKTSEAAGNLKSSAHLNLDKDQPVATNTANKEKNVPLIVADSKKPVEKASTSTENTETSNNSQTPESTEKNESDKIEVLPVIILNTQIGFAPLKVTALLNLQDKGNWDFGDGQALLAANSVTHSFNKPGTYKITCAIGEKIIEQTIEVIGIISTAFTPNGDGINDDFSLESDQLQELNIKVVDRSGKRVYEITQSGQRWDGRDQTGKNLPEGTYFYNIFARSNNGQPINQKGTISIFK